MRWPSDGKRARYECRCCPWELLRGRRFHSKRLLLEGLRAKLQDKYRVHDVVDTYIVHTVHIDHSPKKAPRIELSPSVKHPDSRTLLVHLLLAATHNFPSDYLNCLLRSYKRCLLKFEAIVSLLAVSVGWLGRMVSGEHPLVRHLQTTV